jgi:hypothetical protein
MLSRNRSGDFHVPFDSEDEVLVKASLRVMNNLLRFNICHLESSYIRNHDITDLATRVKENIPEHLSYACRHFADHLSGLKNDGSLQAPVKEFLYEKLLFWLEVLSLLGDTYPAQSQMLAIQAWMKVSGGFGLMEQCA